MRYARLLPVLLIPLFGAPSSHAQQPDTLAPSRPDGPLRFRLPPPIPDTLDILDSEEASYRDALNAARVDPGILHYVVPPPGTVMPNPISPDAIDPQMIHPRSDTLRPHRRPRWRWPRHR